MTARHSEVIRHARVWNERRDRRVAREVAPARNGKFFPGLMNWLALSSALGLQSEILVWFDERQCPARQPRLVRQPGTLERDLHPNHTRFAGPVAAEDAAVNRGPSPRTSDFAMAIDSD